MVPLKLETPFSVIVAVAECPGCTIRAGGAKIMVKLGGKGTTREMSVDCVTPLQEAVITTEKTPGGMEFEAVRVMSVEIVELALSPSVWVVQLVVRSGLPGETVTVALPKKLSMLVKLVVKVDDEPG
jgi:hypothetical protein